jgi:hypothetical protein
VTCAGARGVWARLEGSDRSIPFQTGLDKYAKRIYASEKGDVVRLEDGKLRTATHDGAFPGARLVCKAADREDLQ